MSGLHIVRTAMELTRDQARSRRKRSLGASVVLLHRLGEAYLAHEAEDYPEQPGVDYHRPRTRAECARVPRPCPYVSCCYHLYLDVDRWGNLKLNFPDLEPGMLPEKASCALDVAAGGARPLEVVGELLNLTRERVRQLENAALARLRRHPELAGLVEEEEVEAAHGEY